MKYITLAIAIWGAVTGTTSLIIKILDFRKARPNLKIELSKNHNSFVISNKHMSWRGYTYPDNYFSGVLSITIKNVSQQPVTISKFEYKKYISKTDKNFWVNVITHPEFVKDYRKPIRDSKGIKNISFYTLNLKYAPEFDLPLRINAYETKTIGIFTPFIEEASIKNGEFKFNSKIVSTNKNYHFNVDVPEIHQVVHDFDDYIPQKS